MRFQIGREIVEVNSDTSEELKDLISSGAVPKYNSSTGLGMIEVEGAKFVVLRDLQSDLNVPFYWSGSQRESAKLVVGVETTDVVDRKTGVKYSDGYAIKFTNSKTVDVELKTDDFTTNVAEELRKNVFKQPKFQTLYNYYGKTSTPFIEKVIEVKDELGGASSLVVVNEKSGKKVYLVDEVSKQNVENIFIKGMLVDEKDMGTMQNQVSAGAYLPKVSAVEGTYQTDKDVIVVVQDQNGGLVSYPFTCDLNLNEKINDKEADIGINKRATQTLKSDFKYQVRSIEYYRKHMTSKSGSVINPADFVPRDQYNKDMDAMGKQYQQNLQKAKEELESLHKKEMADLKAKAGKRDYAILGGVDAYRTKGIGKNKTYTDCCFVVAPHVHVNSRDSVYLVEGCNTEEISDLNLTPDEFLTVVKGEAVGTVAPADIKMKGKEISKVNNKNVSGITISGVRTYYTKPGDSIVRVKKFSDNIVKFTWGRDPRYHLEDTRDLRSALNDIQPNIGDSCYKSVGAVKGNVALKHGLTTLAVLLPLVVGAVLGFSGANADKALQNANEQLNDAQQAVDDANKGQDQATLSRNEGIIAEARSNALLRLQDETNLAISYGRTQAETNAELVGTLVGKQYNDGSYDLSGLQALYDTNVRDFDAYEQQSGLTYSAQVYQDNDNDNAADKDANGNYIMVMKDYTLTREEVENAGKTYSYDAATQEGIWSETAKLAVKASLDAGMPVATWVNGGTEMVYNCLYLGSRKEMVDRVGENATTAFENSWASTVQEMIRDGSAGSNAVTNPEDVYQNEDVLYSASLIAGEGAVVVSVNNGTLYIKTADNTKLYAIPTTNGDSLEAEDLIASIDNVLEGESKLEIEEKYGYTQASKIFTAVYEAGRGSITEENAQRLNAMYGDTYIKHNKFSKDGSYLYYATVCTIDAETGDVEESYGKYVTRNGSLDVNNASALSIGYTGLTAAQKAGYATGAVHTEDSTKVDEFLEKTTERSK